MEPRTINSADAIVDLVSRIRAGDQQAEAELVERYSGGVKIIIRREIGSASTADDIYQEAFRIIIEKIRRGDVREPEKLSGFVCGVARNLVIDYFRRSARQESVHDVEEATLLPDPAPDQLEALLRKEQADIVRQVLKEMRNERDIQILFRFYLAEDKKEQICADLGLTSLHFNRVLHRARERYLELYQRLISDKS
jgi:RNA polymerase sigma-70 factor, ECF subfamily